MKTVEELKTGDLIVLRLSTVVRVVDVSPQEGSSFKGNRKVRYEVVDSPHGEGAVDIGEKVSVITVDQAEEKI